MRYDRVFLSLSLVTLFVAPLLAHGDETRDLKAAFEAEIGAVNARALEALMGTQHERVISLSPASPSPIDGKAARRQGYQKLFETMEAFTVTPHNPQYRVVGDTGVVWGTYTMRANRKVVPPPRPPFGSLGPISKRMGSGSCSSTMSLQCRRATRVSGSYEVAWC